MFKKRFPSLSSLGSDGNTSFLRAARAGNLDKVLEHLDKNNVDINTSNTNGLNALHLASKDGHIHVVTELLKRKADVNSATKKGNTALHIASLAGQEEVVRLLVENGAKVNVQSQSGFTPLYMAAQENHDNVVKYLLANGANQSLATEDGFTPLAVAMQQGHDKVVAVLLENDTRGKIRLPALHIAAKKDDCKAATVLLQNEHNPDITSKSGFTPLHIASHYGNDAIANLLLNRGADVNYSARHNITPLHVAAKWGKTNMVALLLAKKANIEAKTRDGLTPLHCAARSGHEPVVDMLLQLGAPISSKTKNGLAPLHMASQGDHVDAARILLFNKAPVDDVTVDYLTALHVAAHCGHVHVAKLLLDRKADPNARALNGFTPLHIACKKNRIKVVELLLKRGASIEATTETGLTPLHVASFMGCMNIVIYLLQNEANPDIPTVRGETPLHLAARANQTDIIRILLRNGAQVDARAREQQTPLHIAARLGNVDIVMLLLQHGAAVDSTTKDLYNALHIAAKEGQDEVAQILVDNNASFTATTKKGFTPLHLAAKYGNMKVAKLLLQRDAPVDAQGKNGITPLHVASHYDHQNVALLLLDKGASPHATAKNGHTPLHIAAKKNQMDIASTLLEYGAKTNAESRAGFSPLHLSSQEGHTDMSSLLIEHFADTNQTAKNGLTPLHLCAQEDRVEVAKVLVKNGADVNSTTKAGYTPLHVASHFGQLNMVRFLTQNNSNVNASTAVGYTPLHQAAQQGHSAIVNILLENGAPPNAKTVQGQTALSIAQKLGYISVVENLKGVTEPLSIGGVTMEEKYKVVSPETMQETFMSDSEDEGGEDTLLSEQPYRYLTVDEMKSLGDDSLPIDVTRDERFDPHNRDNMSVPPTAVDDTISPQHMKEHYSQFNTPDNVEISKHPPHVGFLVSFLVDARGGAMRGCRHSGVRVIVPPRRASMPMRVTCRYLKRDKISHPPPLMEGEALASRILELGPVGAKFLGPVVIEVPHFGSLRGKEREIVILRSDNGETWREHTVEANEEAIHDVLSLSFDKEELSQMEESGRTTRILTTDFPHYFAIVTRVRQEVHPIGPEGGMVSSSVVPQVQAVFPQGALTKKIKVGLQAQPIPAELAAKLLGNRVAVSPIVTVEPRRRKFHKPITLTIPVPQAANKGMINQYSGDAPTLRLLCSITGGTTRAQWEDVTGSTPLTFVNDCVSFTTTVSARFWLMDCRNITDATRMATELYKEAIHVPFMAKFVVFAKRIDLTEARLRVFCMTDDKEDKTLECQEHFTEVAKSRDVEVLEGKSQYVEFAANLVPVTKSGEQLHFEFRAFRENRLPFTVRLKDPHAEPVGRALFMKEPKVLKGEPPQQPICVLNIVLPEEIISETGVPEHDLHKFEFVKDSSGLRLSEFSNLLGDDWVRLAHELCISNSDINRIKSDHSGDVAQQGIAMLRFWVKEGGNKASSNTLETALTEIGREDIAIKCIYNDQSGFDLLKEELISSKDITLKNNVNIYGKDDIKESESAKHWKDQDLIIHDTKIKTEKKEKTYIPEDKVVEEKKSVSEIKKEIEQRLSQEKEMSYEKKFEKSLSQDNKFFSEKIDTSVNKTNLIESEKQIKEVFEEKTNIFDDEEPSDLTFAEKRLSFEKALQKEIPKPEEKLISKTFIFEEQIDTEIKEKIQPKTDIEETQEMSFAEKRKSFEQGQLIQEKVIVKVPAKESFEKPKVTIPSEDGKTVDVEKKDAAKEKKDVIEKKESVVKKKDEVDEKNIFVDKADIFIEKKYVVDEKKDKAVEIKDKITAVKDITVEKRDTVVEKTEASVEIKDKIIEMKDKAVKNEDLVIIKAEPTTEIINLVETKEIDNKQKLISQERSSADQRRDSELFEGVTETLGRLEKVDFKPQVQDLLSPLSSKTPPPSPAEFSKETKDAPSWLTTASEITSEKNQPLTDWASKSSTPQDPKKLDLVPSSSYLEYATKDKSNVSSEIILNEQNSKEPELESKAELQSSNDPINIYSPTKFIVEETLGNKKQLLESNFKIEVPTASLTFTSSKNDSSDSSNKNNLHDIGNVQQNIKQDEQNNHLNKNIETNDQVIKRDNFNNFSFDSKTSKLKTVDDSSKLDEIKTLDECGLDNKVPIKSYSFNKDSENIEKIKTSTESQEINLLKTCEETHIKLENKDSISELLERERDLKIVDTPVQIIIDKGHDTDVIREIESNLFDTDDVRRDILSHKLNDNDLLMSQSLEERTEANVIDKKLSELNKSSLRQTEQLNDILMDMLIEQETSAQSSSFNTKELSDCDIKAFNDILLDPGVSSITNNSVETDIFIPKDETNYEEKNNVCSESQNLSGENVVSYVTTPTMQRRKIGGSQRLSREERPALMEISHITNDSSEESDQENYIVTEPPDSESPFGQRQRKVKFQIKTNEPDFKEVGDPKFDIEFEEIRDASKTAMQYTDSTFEDCGKNKVLNEYSIKTTRESPDKSEKKFRRVERHFERMASETLEGDPVSANSEGEFQRMVSQLSTEEVNECLQLWDEGGLTPSSELDSKDATEGDVEDEFEQLPQAVAVSPYQKYDSTSNDEGNVSENIPSSVFWSFTNNPIQPSVVIPEDLAIPLEPGKIKITVEENSSINIPTLESPMPILNINTLGQSYNVELPDKEINFDSRPLLIKGAHPGAESGSSVDKPSVRERDEIQTENSEALESSSATDKPSSSGESGAAPSQGLPQTKK